MRVIAHISDLYFGAEDRDVAEALIDELNTLAPAVVVVSGDLTERASSKQYKAAFEFLNRIGFPKIVVPGNRHFNIFRRFLLPLWITTDVTAFYIDAEMAVLGINTVRSLNRKSGTNSLEQIQFIKSELCRLDNHLFKIIVVHHHIIPSPNHNSKGSTALFLTEIEKCGIDLILSGHIHKGNTGGAKQYYAYKSLVIAVQGGTAISKRRGGELNSYHVINVNKENCIITRKTYERGCFSVSRVHSYKRMDGNWILQTIWRFKSGWWN